MSAKFLNQSASAATVVVAVIASTIVASAIVVVVTAAANENNDKDNYPSTAVTTKEIVTHKKFPPFDWLHYILCYFKRTVTTV